MQSCNPLVSDRVNFDVSFRNWLQYCRWNQWKLSSYRN